MELIQNDWDGLLAEEMQKEYFIQLQQFLDQEYKTKRIYPPREDIYNALRYTAYHDVKVLLLGQDPYHGDVYKRQ